MRKGHRKGYFSPYLCFFVIHDVANTSQIFRNRFLGWGNGWTALATLGLRVDRLSYQRRTLPDRIQGGENLLDQVPLRRVCFTSGSHYLAESDMALYMSVARVRVYGNRFCQMDSASERSVGDFSCLDYRYMIAFIMLDYY